MTTNPIPPMIPTPVKSVLYTHHNLTSDQQKMSIRIRSALRANTHKDMSVSANRLTLANDLQKAMGTARLKPLDKQTFIKVAINELHKSKKEFTNLNDDVLKEISDLLSQNSPKRW